MITNTCICVKYFYQKAIYVKIVLIEVIKHFEKVMMGKQAEWSKANKNFTVWKSMQAKES